MELRLVQLRLKKAFNLSQATAETKQTLIARYGGGLGEGSSSIHYGVPSAECLELTNGLLARLGDTPDRSAVESLVAVLPPSLNVSRCAIEMAILDHDARRRQLPLYRFLELDPPGEIASSATVTPGSTDDLKRQMEEFREFRALKLKVGFKDDLRFVDEVLKLREARLRLDANGGWTKSEATERIKALHGYPIDFFEQPLAQPALRDLDEIKTRTECTLILDESIKTIKDIEVFRPVCDGVNLKLSKCGGITRVVEMARLARNHGLKLLLGCMIESAIGITAALHLASLFDYFDLDAILLTDNDPFWGAHFAGDRLLLPGGSGIGIAREETALA